MAERTQERAGKSSQNKNNNNLTDNGYEVPATLRISKENGKLAMRAQPMTVDVFDVEALYERPDKFVIPMSGKENRQIAAGADGYLTVKDLLWDDAGFEHTKKTVRDVDEKQDNHLYGNDEEFLRRLHEADSGGIPLEWTAADDQHCQKDCGAYQNSEGLHPDQDNTSVCVDDLNVNNEDKCQHSKSWDALLDHAGDGSCSDYSAEMSDDAGSNQETDTFDQTGHNPEVVKGNTEEETKYENVL